MIKIQHNKRTYNIDLNEVIDLSIPYNFNGKQPNFYNVKKGTLRPLKTDNIDWDVSMGASCNVSEISMNIHCSGTHTESVGHLLKKSGDIGLLLTKPIMAANLITIDTINFCECSDKYHCDVNDYESVISVENFLLKYNKYCDNKTDVLIVRTKPNHENKIFTNYTKSPAPFFTNDTISMIYELKIKHLIVDIPSIDRSSDNGILGNHRMFWGNGFSPHTKINPKSKKTITELAYIPNSVKDGFYFVNIQIPHFVSDAAPSRPLLFKSFEV